MPSASKSKLDSDDLEPEFCSETGAAIPKSLLEGCLSYVADKNVQLCDNPAEFRDVCCTPLAVELIFSVTKKLGQKNDVKYMAVELFDRFLYQHIKDVYKEWETMHEKGKRQTPPDWKQVETRIQKQVMLRAVSCIQIASKNYSHYDFVTTTDCWNFLRSVGNYFTKEAILKSELRVLDTLQFRVNILTPLTYIEMFLELVGQGDSWIKPQIKSLYEICLKILDFTYKNRRRLHRELQRLAGNGDAESILSPASMRVISRLKYDDALLSTSIIASSAYFVGDEIQRRVLVQLQQITKISEADISDFSSILVALLVDSRE